jgi:hypothetical protein
VNRDRRLRLPVRLAALAAVGVAAALCVWFDPVGRGVHFDNQLYFYIAERVASGEAPHVVLVDHKHQVSTLLSGAAMALGRLVGIDDVAAGRGLSIAMALATAAATTLASAAIWRSALAAWFAAAVIAGFPDFYFQAVVGFRPKVFMAGFLSLALLAHARARPLLAGLLAAASFHCWQPALLATAAIGASLLWARRWSDALRFTLGFIVFTAGYEAWFALHGALGEQLFQSYRMPADAGGYQYPSMAKGLKFFASLGLWRQTGQVVLGLGFLAMVAALPLYTVRRFGSASERVREQPAVGAWGLLSVAAVAMTFVDHQGYPDLFFVQPLIAIGFGGLLAGLLARLPGGAPARLFVAALMVVAIAANGASRRTSFGSTKGGLVEQREQAALLDLLEEEYGPVWAIGCPHLLALEHRENFSPFAMLIDPKVRRYAAALYGPGGLDPVRDGLRPGVLVISRGGERAAMPFMDRWYRRLPIDVFSNDGIHVWVARDGRRRPDARLGPPPGRERPGERGAEKTDADGR